jgi:glutamate N-acetyltransferase/amino-acid N-acetyltransferase
MLRTEKGVCVPGFSSGGVKRNGYGVALIASEDRVNSAMMVTSNRVKAAPLIVSMDHYRAGDIRAIVASSGCANAYTGDAGVSDAERMCSLAAEKLGLRAENVLVASTGLIGRRLDMGAIEAALGTVELGSSKRSSLDAANAIKTTDRYPKMISVKTELATGDVIEIGGIAKGAGMIAPDLMHATMLCFITTNAYVPDEKIHAALEEAVAQSFNVTVVDGDTSTNDMVVLLANGRAGNEEIDENFQEALNYVTRELAKLMAKDGEGATKLIEVEVNGARSRDDAVKAAKSIVSSTLVKTAFFGEDPNWGRIVAALGYSGADFDPGSISISYSSRRGTVDLVKKGTVLSNEGKELKARDVLKADEIRIILDLDSGMGRAVAFGCDLSLDYVKLNSSYSS